MAITFRGVQIPYAKHERGGKALRSREINIMATNGAYEMIYGTGAEPIIVRGFSEGGVTEAQMRALESTYGTLYIHGDTYSHCLCTSVTFGPLMGDVGLRDFVMTFKNLGS